MSWSAVQISLSVGHVCDSLMGKPSAGDHLPKGNSPGTTKPPAGVPTWKGAPNPVPPKK
jgi:hypothetical protein